MAGTGTPLAELNRLRKDLGEDKSDQEWLTLHHAFCFISYKMAEFQKYLDERAPEPGDSTTTTSRVKRALLARAGPDAVAGTVLRTPARTAAVRADPREARREVPDRAVTAAAAAPRADPPGGDRVRVAPLTTAEVDRVLEALADLA